MEKIHHLLILLAISITLFGCGKVKAPPEQTTSQQTTPSTEQAASMKKLKVAMVTDVGGLGDQSFNDSAYEGLKQTEKELGAEIKVLESKAMSDYETNLSSLAEIGYDVIFAVGFLMTDSVKKVAPRYPNVKFGLIDGRIEDVSNVTSCIFKEEEGSFLAGALAGLMTKTKKVGFVGGIKGWLIEKFESGYKAGVLSANPKVQVLISYTGRFDDPGKGKETALAQFNQGADIVYHASGSCGIGVIEAAKEKGKGFYAIGVDADQDHLAEGRVLTSMMKRVDVAVFETVKDVNNGTFKNGIVEFGISQNAVSLSPMRFTKTDIPKSTLAAIEKLQSKIISRELSIPNTLEKLKEFKPPVIVESSGKKEGM